MSPATARPTIAQRCMCRLHHLKCDILVLRLAAGISGESLGYRRVSACIGRKVHAKRKQQVKLTYRIDANKKETAYIGAHETNGIAYSIDIVLCNSHLQIARFQRVTVSNELTNSQCMRKP